MELQSRNHTNFPTVNSVWVTQIYFITNFVINKQRRNVSQTVFHRNNVALSPLHMQVNFFDKTCDGIELTWPLPTSGNTAAWQLSLPKSMHSSPAPLIYFLWGCSRVFKEHCRVD